jgi:phage terminase large subunit-like protein
MLLHERLYVAARMLLDLGCAELREVAQRLQPEDASAIEHALRHDWPLWARPKQRLPAGPWRWLVFLAGRNWGKTLAGAQATREAAESGQHEWLSIVGPTFQNVLRDQLSGPSGILTISPRWFRPEYIVGRSELRYPAHPVTGIRTRVALLSADKPERIRGSQASFVWCDEPQSWTKAQAAFDMVDFTLRLGAQPRGVITMTPRTNAFTRDLILGVRDDSGTRRGPRRDLMIVRGSTYENRRIAPDALESLRQAYAGTSLGRQELDAELLAAPEAALWTRDVIDQFRVPGIPVEARLRRRVVSVDPSRSPLGMRDLCGIVAMALNADGHIYVLEDASARGGPLQWARRAAEVAQRYAADAIIFESNSLSGEVAGILRQVAGASGTHWQPVTAQGTKQQRAEPVAALYAAGRVHHVGRGFEQLEEELCAWDPTTRTSPDRMDALVHGITELGRLATRRPLVIV